MGTEFTPISAVIGGAIIALSFILFILTTGQGGGISCMFDTILRRYRPLAWRFSFIFGLFAGGLVIGQLYPQSMEVEFFASPYLVALGGFLVGYGSRIGGGCTSGHGIIGNGRFSPRAFVATIFFMIGGIITATLMYGT